MPILQYVQQKLPVTLRKVLLPNLRFPQLCEVVQVDRAVARFFFATGTSFHRLQSPYFDEMLAAVAKFGPSYHKPNINQLREGLLTDEVQRVETELGTTVLDQIETTGGTAASDGWTAVDNRPLLNALLVTPKGPCFRTAIDTSGKVKANSSEESLF